MEDYSFLLILAIILVSTKLFGVASERIHLPQVVGALMAGIVLGPSGFGVLESNEFLTYTAEIGVIMLMFTAGIDTDMRELKETGVAATVVAVAGVIVPIVLCGGVYWFFFEDQFGTEAMLRTAFFGVIFAATSVSITVETLNEMGKLKTRMGTTLLSAALIDDIIGVVLLSVLTSMSGSSNGSIIMVLGRIALFFIFTLFAGLIVYRIFAIIATEHWHSRRVAIWSFAFCLFMSYAAEAWFGVADITGAFFAGLILCNLTKARQFVAKKVTVASYMFFAPVFFACIGMKTDIHEVTSEIFLFAGILLVATIVSKVIGCGLGARLCGMTRSESLAIGVGMMSRGEVALIVAEKGVVAGLIAQSLLPTVVVSVIVVSLLTPIFLRIIILRSDRKAQPIACMQPEPRGC